MTPGRCYLLAVKRPRGPVIRYRGQLLQETPDDLLFLNLENDGVKIRIHKDVLEGEPMEFDPTVDID